MEGAGQSRLYESGGGAEKSRHRGSPGGGGTAQIRPRAPARSVSHARLRCEALSKMGNGAHAEGSRGQTRTRAQVGGHIIVFRKAFLGGSCPAKPAVPTIEASTCDQLGKLAA